MFGSLLVIVMIQLDFGLSKVPCATGKKLELDIDLPLHL